MPSGPAVCMSKTLQILVADDHEVVRCGLRALLEERPHWQIVAEAADGKEAIARALQTRPNIAIVDYSLPLINGIEATRQIRARLAETQVLIFSMHESEALIHDLLEAGARGYVLKSDAKRFLVAAVESLAAGKPYFTGRVSEALLKSFVCREACCPTTLTARERGVVQLVAEGHSNKAIAGILNISVKTVEAHRAVTLRKLDLSSTAALTRYAIRNKIVEA